MTSVSNTGIPTHACLLPSLDYPMSCHDPDHMADRTLVRVFHWALNHNFRNKKKVNVFYQFDQASVGGPWSMLACIRNPESTVVAETQCRMLL